MLGSIYTADCLKPAVSYTSGSVDSKTFWRYEALQIQVLSYDQVISDCFL